MIIKVGNSIINLDNVCIVSLEDIKINFHTINEKILEVNFHDNDDALENFKKIHDAWST